MNLAALRAAGRTPPLPLSLELSTGQPLVIEHWLRILPGKRLTGVGTWQGHTVLAKLFIAPRGSERHWRRERSGAKHLLSHGLPTPAIRAAGHLDGDGHYLLYDFLPAARSPVADDAEDLKQVFTLLGHMHAQWLIQADAHLDNFLFTAGQLHVIDGDAVRPTTRPEEHLDNLALLFAQLTPAVENALRAPLLAAYCAGHPAAAIEAIALAAAIDRARTSRLEDFLDKTLRDCSLFHVTRSTDRFLAMVRTCEDKLAPLLADPDAWLERGEPLKRGRTATLARVDVSGMQVVIKRYNIKNAAHALSRAWRPSRAWHAWLEGHRLGFLGIATPRPLALIERRIGPLRGKAWLVTEYCPGVSLSDHLANRVEQPPADVVDAVTELCGQLVALHISHGDLKATNLLWHENRLHLIDLDAMHQHGSASTFGRAWRKDRARLLDNWPADSVLHATLERRLPPPAAG